MNRALILLTALLALTAPACGPSYPKGKLDESIKKLFEKEVGTKEAQSQMVGRTLYVSFPIENMVTTSMDLPKDVTEKLEAAMLSVTRIAMSTDEKIDFMVLKARDVTWGAETIFVRRLEDLKFMYYMKISRSDFDERFIMETRKFDPSNETPEEPPHDITLPEFMARWVAFRINLGSRANLFLGILLGVDHLTPRIDPETKTLILSTDSKDSSSTNSSSSISTQLLQSTVFEQMNKVEKKYLSRLHKNEAWVESLEVVDSKGNVLFKAAGSEWRAAKSVEKRKVS